MPELSKKSNNEIGTFSKSQMEVLEEKTKLLLKYIEDYKPPTKKFLKKWRKEMQEFLTIIKKSGGAMHR